MANAITVVFTFFNQRSLLLLIFYYITENIALLVTHSAVTPESSGRGLSDSTFFKLNVLFMRRRLCCQNAISHYPASPSADWQVSKASVAAAGTIRFDSISGRVHRKRIAINHYPASVSAGGSWQVTYFDVSKASVAATAGTKTRVNVFDSISGRVRRKQRAKGKTVRTGMQQADMSLCCSAIAIIQYNWLTID